MIDPTPVPPAGAADTRHQAWLWTALALALATLDLSRHLFHNWVPFDEGAMGLAARLVRGGAWLHQDFTDTYSGGLALLDAGAQALFGDDLRALRIPLGILTIGWVGLLAACFRRFVSPVAAAGLALVAYLWGPPLYTAAMPSWYLLFLATAMVWGLLRWNETGDPRWWGLVGVIIGVALFIKINALFLLAAAGCVLLTSERTRAGLPGAVMVLGGIAGAWLTTLQGWPLGSALTLTGPLTALGAAATWHAHRSHTDAAPTFRPILVMGGWLAAGVALVVVPWVVAYALHGGLPALIDGVLVLPFRRSVATRFVPPGWWLPDLAVSAGFLALVLGRWRRPAAVVTAVLVAVGAHLLVEGATLDARTLVPLVWREFRVVAILGLLLVVIARVREPERPLQPLLIAGWVAAWFAFTQYPFAAPNYLAYVAPLLLLAGAAAASRTVTQPIGAALAFALGVWSVGIDHGQPLWNLGVTHEASGMPDARVDLPRGGLLLPQPVAEGYTAMFRLLESWNTRSLLAGPDSPEFYYLSGLPFHDREFFEFLAPEWSAQVFVDRIRAQRPDVVVFNTRPYFSPVSSDSVDALLPIRPVVDTSIGRYRVMRFAWPPP